MNNVAALRNSDGRVLDVARGRYNKRAAVTYEKELEILNIIVNQRMSFSVFGSGGGKGEQCLLTNSEVQGTISGIDLIFFSHYSLHIFCSR